ncbi:hypothetical protein [Modestobacter sp. KNN46-3]|uniref:hypothetical protein n=1 Tax=Modestobacter sp. KNN46-3 TaxID=2711218 RepID=UPI0019D01E3D|nr:hypothetical protein [Modestobacter sp. KNN46-3]
MPLTMQGLTPYTFTDLPEHDTRLRGVRDYGWFCACECGEEGPPSDSIDEALNWITTHCLSLVSDLTEAELHVAARIVPGFLGTLDELVNTAKAIAA